MLNRKCRGPVVTKPTYRPTAIKAYQGTPRIEAHLHGPNEPNEPNENRGYDSRIGYRVA